VLIPRPETEHVVEAVLELVSSDESIRGREEGQEQEQEQNKEQEQGQNQEQNQEQEQRPRTGVSAPHGIRVVDVGTGSGAIALALAQELPRAEIHATDISLEALELARVNAARHELTSRVEFHHGDLLDGFSPAWFDFVVSNPPYVGEAEEDSVQLEVRKFEPRRAVFAGATGLEVIQRLIPAAGRVLRPGGWLVFEISGTIADGVRGLLASWDDVGIRNDLQGIARVALARKNHFS
jgi:HemK-like putative methylase